jgi:flagellar hook-basal body complex protein FliE
MVTNVGQAIAAYAQAAKATAKPAGASDGEDFGALVSKSLRSVHDTIAKGEAVSLRAIANQADLNEVVMAVTEAEMALQTVVAVRDRVIQAYNDIIKMPI